MNRHGGNGDRKRAAASPASGGSNSERALFLDFQLQAGQVRAAIHEDAKGRPQTLRRYEDAPVSLNDVEKHSARIKELLARANRRGRIGNDVLNGLRQAGQLLYEELFPVRAKQSLGDSGLEFLVLGTDDRLVHIPWELAHDGEEFLCRRFSMGRVVSTRQEFSVSRRRIGAPLSMLILADPQGNLASSYQEGLELRDLLEPLAARAVVTLKSSSIGRDYVKARLRDCDVLHYAGHAEYSAERPAESGFLLADGRLSALELRSLAGRRPFPALVFSNACDSGHTQQWRAADGYQHVYGLANAFLLAGVRHYLGTFWEIPDDPSLTFARAFYAELFEGAPVGQAVRRARQGVAAEYGEGTIFWASYMLYGEPTARYVDDGDPAPARQAQPKAPEAIEVGPLRGAARRGPAGPFGGKAAVAVAVVAAAGLVSVLSYRDRPPPAPRAAAAPVAPLDPMQGINREKATAGLIEELARRYRTGDLPAAPARDEWLSIPLAVVFLGVEPHGPSRSERDFLVGVWAERLRASSPRLSVVERRVLDDLLRELHLGSSDLADPGAALKLGRVLAANLIVTGSVSREGDEWLVSLRMIETETTSVKATVSTFRRDADLTAVADTVAAELLDRVHQTYPLQARVVSVTDGVAVSAGAALGLKAGQHLALLADSGEPVGELEVVSVEADHARARLLGPAQASVGQRVREILPGHAP